MFPNLPQLKILPVPALLLHEDHDRQRTLPLVEKLRVQGILRNPPIVMPLEDGSGRYMVLDGANRVTALQEMEFPHIVAQVAKPDDPDVQLMTWNHVVWGMSTRDLLAHIRDVVGIKIKPLNRKSTVDTAPDCMPVHVQLADGRAYLACATGDLMQQVTYLHGVVDSYKDCAFLDRTSQTEIEFFKDVHADLTALFIFPNLSVSTVLDLVAQGYLLPSGITRFTVSPRALHLNYPLHELSSAKPVEYKEAYLNHWIQEHIKQKSVRFYAEATLLFDE
jgi:hypothetical protein